MQLQKAALRERPPSSVGVDMAKKSLKNSGQISPEDIKYQKKMPNQIGGQVTAVGDPARAPLPAELVHI